MLRGLAAKAKGRSLDPKLLAWTARHMENMEVASREQAASIRQADMSWQETARIGSHFGTVSGISSQRWRFHW